MPDGLQGVQMSGGALDPRGPRREEVVRPVQVVRAAQVAREAEVRLSANGVRFATFGETGVPAPDLDRMLEAVPAAIGQALGANTYYFVPLALREVSDGAEGGTGELDAFAKKVSQSPEQAMVARAWTDELGESAICHRNVELSSGHRGVFISTRLMGDRFALSFEFFINVAHAFADAAGVPEKFAELVWQQAVDGVRGETSLDAWESRNLAFGREPNAQPDEPRMRRSQTFARSRPFSSEPVAAQSEGAAQAGGAPASGAVVAGARVVDEKERRLYLEAAFSDAVAIYLLSLALDFDYTELREREYPLLAPVALAARLKTVAEMYPANPGYQFSVRYRRRA